MMNEMHLSGGAFQALTQRLSKNKKDEPTEWTYVTRPVIHRKNSYLTFYRKKSFVFHQN